MFNFSLLASKKPPRWWLWKIFIFFYIYAYIKKKKQYQADVWGRRLLAGWRLAGCLCHPGLWGRRSIPVLYRRMTHIPVAMATAGSRERGLPGTNGLLQTGTATQGKAKPSQTSQRQRWAQPPTFTHKSSVQEMFLNLTGDRKTFFPASSPLQKWCLRYWTGTQSCIKSFQALQCLC